jgi:hypothetical protein
MRQQQQQQRIRDNKAILSPKYRTGGHVSNLAALCAWVLQHCGCAFRRRVFSLCGVHVHVLQVLDAFQLKGEEKKLQVSSRKTMIH